MADDIVKVTAQWSAEADRRLADLLPEGTPVAVLDYPYHDNFGDAAIWMGEKVWLARNGNRRRYVADVGRYSALDLAAAHPDGPILLHGGGNFGDYWPEHQVHREQVLADFPDRRIIQLPQAIGFQDPSGQARVAEAMTRHPQFTIMVRDERSLALGREMGLDIVLVPDAALNLGPLRRRGRATTRLLVLARTDHESSGLREHALAHPDPDAVVEDWILGRNTSAAWSLAKAAPRLLRRLPAGSPARVALARRLAPCFDAMARLMVSAAVRQLSAADVLVTDRLHAHVIATLLGIPNVVVDNNYGKVRGVYDAFTHEAPDVVFAAGPEAALAAAHALITPV